MDDNSNMKTRDFGQHIAIFAIAVGLFVYILIDTGLIGKIIGFDPSGPVASSSTAEIQKYRDELKNIDIGIQQKKTEVEDLQSRLASLNISIKTKSRDLAKIFESDKIDASKGKRSRKDSQGSDVKVGENQELVSRVTINSLGDVREALDKAFPDESELRVDSDYGKEWLQFAFHQPYSEGSVFLRPRGLYWSQIISKAAKTFDTREILVGYHGGQVEYEKAQVLKNYLAKLTENSISVDLKHMPESVIKSQSQIDVFMKKTAKGGFINEN